MHLQNHHLSNNIPLLDKLQTQRLKANIKHELSDSVFIKGKGMQSPVHSPIDLSSKSRAGANLRFSIEGPFVEESKTLVKPPLSDMELKEEFKTNIILRQKTKEWNTSITSKKKNFLKAKRRKVLKSKPLFVENIDYNFEEIEDDNVYYKILFGDLEAQSDVSLHVTTPGNPHEIEEDEELAGEEAIHNMHSKFRKYKKIKEKEKLDKKKPKYPLVEFLDAIDNNRILPKTMGLVKTKPNKGNKDVFSKIKTIFVGKDYAGPLSEGLKVIKSIKELDLGASDLTYDRLLPILEKVPMSLEELKIPQNFKLSATIFKMIGSLLDDNKRV